MVGTEIQTPNGICFKQFREKYSNLRKIVFSRVIELYCRIKIQRANDTIAANLHSNILDSIQSSVLPIERIWKFERRSRDYRRMLRDQSSCRKLTKIIEIQGLSSAYILKVQANIIFIFMYNTVLLYVFFKFPCFQFFFF